MDSRDRLARRMRRLDRRYGLWQPLGALCAVATGAVAVVFAAVLIARQVIIWLR